MMTDKTYINIWGLKLVLHLVPFDHWLVTYYWHHGPQIFTAQLFCPRLFPSPAIVTIVPILVLCPNIVSILALCRPQSLVLNLTTCAHTIVTLAWLALHKPVKSFGERAWKASEEEQLTKSQKFPQKLCWQGLPTCLYSCSKTHECAVGNVKKTMRMTTGG